MVKEYSGFELYLSVNTERNYNTLLKAINESLSRDVISQKAYSFQVLFNNTEYNLENDIMGIEFKNRTNFSLPNYSKSLSNLKFLLYEKKNDYWFVVHAGSGRVHNEFDGS